MAEVSTPSDVRIINKTKHQSRENQMRDKYIEIVKACVAGDKVTATNLLEQVITRKTEDKVRQHVQQHKLKLGR